MKAIKLKPLFFPSDDILVKPPDVLCDFNQVNKEKLRDKTVSGLNQLINILRGRKLKRSNAGQSKYLEDEKETVKKLTEWKRPASPSSPITRKYTFRRTFTLNNLNSSLSPEKSPPKEKPKSLLRPKTIDIFTGTVQAILATEKLKKKVQEEEFKNLSSQNLEYESEIKDRIERLKRALKGLKSFIYESQSKLSELKNSFEEAKKKHEEDTNSLSLLEAQELLFKDKTKKNRIQDEATYFIKKEKLRKMKQELHKAYLEVQEKFSNEINSQTRTAESAEHSRRMYKKQVKEYREELIMLYCRLLKDGKDARADGLRWIIKSLWHMHEAVPISAFPKFLDDESAHFLLKLSELEIEQQVFAKQLSVLQQDFKNSRPASCIPSAFSLYNNVKGRLRQISQSSVGKSPISQKPLKQDSKENSTPSSYSEVSALKTRINRHQDEINNLTSIEIKRVTDNYGLNADVEEVGLFHVIRCLVGEKVREFNRYTRSTFMGMKSKV